MVASAFPAMFTLVCLSVFLVPLYIVTHIGHDENVRYWIGRHLDLVAFLPILFLATHILHYWRRGPVRGAIITCLVGSCLLLLVLGNFVLMDVSRFGNAFMALDCYALTGKQALQVEWEEARDYYANCVAELSMRKNLSYAYVVDHYRVRDCHDYEAVVAEEHARSWPYLEYLEEHYRCAGWCRRSQAIWTFQSTQDACSPVVANIFLDKVQWSMLQVVIYILAVFAAVSATVALGAPFLSKFGIAWQASGGVWHSPRWGAPRAL